MKSKKFSAIFVVMAFFLAAICPSYAYAESATQKDETVYVNLGDNGGVDSIYVVNEFEMDCAGMVTDYGNYASVRNLTSTDAVESRNGVNTVNASPGRFYYQGELTQDTLPWRFDITYLLNGTAVDPQTLAGASGDIEIRIEVTQGDAQYQYFYDHYVLQISLTLSNDICTGIEAPEATVASAGKNTTINCMVMPGKDADLHIFATARDFTMAGIQVSGIPLSINIDSPDTEDMLDDFEKLSDGISELNDGVGDLVDGVVDMKEGTGKLADGSTDIQDGISELGDNSGKLIEASEKIEKALKTVASSVNGSLSGGVNMTDMEQLPEGLTQLADGLTSISGGLTQLQTGFATAYTALATAIEDILDTEITEDEINTLYANTDPSQYGLLDELTASYTAAQTVKGTYGQVKGAFDAVNTTIPTLAGAIDGIAETLHMMSQNITDALSSMDILEQLTMLADGLTELSENYGDFHEGLETYMDGVETLAEGYPEFHDGVTQFNDGVGDLYDGVVKLHDGTTELNDKTESLPDDIQSEIDDMIEEFSGSDFEPVSFVDEANDVSNVVFVMKTGKIVMLDPAEPEEVSAGSDTFFEKLLGLFGLHKD